jgi:hypothetical protein
LLLLCRLVGGKYAQVLEDGLGSLERSHAALHRLGEDEVDVVTGEDEAGNGGARGASSGAIDFAGGAGGTGGAGGVPLVYVVKFKRLQRGAE